MELTSEQRQLIVHCLRVAAERFRQDAKTAESSDLTIAAKTSFGAVFMKQAADATDLADSLENPQPRQQPCGTSHPDDAECLICERHYDHL